MRNQASVLQFIPVIPTRNANPTLSIWQRARAAVSSAVIQVRAVVTRVVAVVTRKITGLRASIARVVRAALVRRPWILTRDGAGHAASRTLSWCGDTWRRVVRPFVRVRVVALGIGVALVGLVASPVVTLVAIAGCGVALVGLSRLISVLEGSSRPTARAVLTIIEYAARIGRALAYAATAVVVVSISLASVAFAVTEVLELVLRYLDIACATALATLAFFVLTANWGLAAIETAWLVFSHRNKMSRLSVEQAYESEGAEAARARDGAAYRNSASRQAIPLIRIDAERAWNGDPGVDDAQTNEDETVNALTLFASVNDIAGSGVPAQSHARSGKCMGCDLDDRGARFGLGKLTSLCSECFSFLVEDELVNAAEDGQVSAEDVVLAIAEGIQVPAAVIIASGARLRSTRIDLDIEDVTCRMSVRSDSEKDSTRIYWVETAWWFDGRCNRRARRWHGFVAGRVAARVEYVHDRGIRGFYVAEPRRPATSPDGMGPYRTLRYAQEIASDEISDLRVADAFKLEVVLDGALRSVS